MWFVQWSLDHSTGLALEANWKGWKSLISRRLLNWPKLKQKTNKKKKNKKRLWAVIYATGNDFFDQIARCNKKWVASLQNHYISGLCQTNQCNALRITLSAAVLNQQVCPVLLHDKTQPHGTQSTFQKFYIWAATSFPSLPHSTGSSPAIFFKHLTTFCRENTCRNSRMQNILFRMSL